MRVETSSLPARSSTFYACFHLGLWRFSAAILSYGRAARLAAERLHLQAGIVGEQQSVRMTSVVERFLDGIGFKGRTIFHRRRQLFETRQQFDFDAGIFRSLAEFTQFACVARRTVESHQ